MIYIKLYFQLINYCEKHVDDDGLLKSHGYQYLCFLFFFQKIKELLMNHIDDCLLKQGLLHKSSIKCLYAFIFLCLETFMKFFVNDVKVKNINIIQY